MKLSPIAAAFALLLFTCLARSADETPQSNETKAVARIIARLAVPSLSFDDKESSKEVISALDSADYFIFGVLLDTDKKIVASYFRKDAISKKEEFLAEIARAIPQDKSETMRTNSEYILIITPVKFAGDFLGYAVVARTIR